MIQKMSKPKTKVVRKEKEEVKGDFQEMAEQKIDQKCAEDIEMILKTYSRALQPYMVYAELGAVPRVRLVRVKKDAEPSK